MDKYQMLDVLKRHFGSVKEAAEKFGTSRDMLYQSINGYGSREVRLKLAQFFEKRPSEIWQNDSAARAKDDVDYLRALTHKENTPC